MPVRDKFHAVVKNALIFDGWRITDDPLFLHWGGVDLYVDLAADKLIAAEREGQKIAIEIKSFLDPSIVAEFHLAIGQYINYRHVLQNKDPQRQLYLAIPADIHNIFFQTPFAQSVIAAQAVRLIVYDVTQEVIVKWVT